MLNSIEIKGRYVKIAGMNIIKVPVGKKCVIRGFVIKDRNIEKQGEIFFVDDDQHVFEIVGNIFK
jgi:hypothetical protein